jgi:iron(III) transport system substrate-binding protein
MPFQIHSLVTSALLSVGLIAGLTSCGSDDSDRSITVYSGRSEKLVGPIFETFETATGVDLDVRYGSSNDLALVLSAEGDKTTADVFLSRSPGPVGYLDDLGMLSELSSEVLDRVSIDHRSPEGRWVGFAGRGRVLVYNTDETDETDLPDSVFDLTGPEYEGRVAIPGSNSSFQDWFTVFRLRNGDDVAIQWLEDMVANNSRFYPKNGAIVEAVGRNEIQFGLVNHYYNFQKVATNGDAQRSANHGFAPGDDGGLMIIATAAVVAQSDNQDLGQQLVAYLLSAEQQNYLTETVYEYPLAVDVSPNAALPPIPVDTVGAIDMDDVAAEFTRTIEIIEASGVLDQ